MKKIIWTILIALAGINAYAQDNNIPSENKTKEKGSCPKIYITTSTGINNNTGIAGFSIDVPVSQNVSIDAGPGTGTWGYKVYAGAKYYLKPCHRGFAFGTGLTYCPGVYHDKHNLTTVYGYDETIEYNKNPMLNILFAAYKYWNLGKKYNRIYVELGWSVLLTNGDRITQLTGAPISDQTLHDLGSTVPGGPIIAAGFSFGVH